MKCLSLIQPYAQMVVLGKKTIELRKWNTKFRGEFLIHASKKVDLEACKKLGFDPKDLPRGAIIGKARIYDVKSYKSKRQFLADSNKHFADYKKYSSSKYGFLLKNSSKLKDPISYKGMLNFFSVD